MSMKLRSLSLALVAALSVSACGKDEPAQGAAATAPVAVAAVTPTSSIDAGVAALRNNDVMGLLTSVLPAGEIDRMRTEYANDIKSAQVTDEERQQFADQMKKLTDPGAEEALMAELTPQLAEMGPQLPMMVGFFKGMALSSIQQNPDMSPEQKTQATNTMNAVGSWLETADLANPDLARKAVGIVCETARKINITDLDQARALSFDDAVAKAGVGLGGLKDMLGVYGVDMNKMLDSVKTEVVSEQGDAAKIKVSYDLFGTAQTTETELVKQDGRWYGKDVLEGLKKAATERATAEADAISTPADGSMGEPAATDEATEDQG
jgi:hypothetical protein